MNQLLWLLAASAGMTVANLYYAQPLLGELAETFGSTPATVGLLITAAQLGYAAGLVLIVPLADSHDRRRLILGVVAGGMLGLVAAGLAPSLPFLIGASFLLGHLRPCRCAGGAARRPPHRPVRLALGQRLRISAGRA